MQRKDAPFARTKLHHREITAAGVVQYLPLRSPPSGSLAVEPPPRRAFSDLVVAALSWVFNEIVQGLAAYADTIHPIVPPNPAGTSARQAPAQIAEEHRANSQSPEAARRHEAYVTMMMVRANAWTPPRSGRGSR